VQRDGISLRVMEGSTTQLVAHLIAEAKVAWPE
jgi:hypothetical protein